MRILFHYSPSRAETPNRYRTMNLPSILKASFLLLAFLASTLSYAEEKPSVFKKDEKGVLWFEQGNDDETKYSATYSLSAKTDGIVILVMANEEYIEKAVGLAVKMSKALQKSEHTPDDISVVAFKDDKPGAYYKFYTDGMYVGVKNFGIYGPSEAKSRLKDVVIQHQLLKRRVAKGEWGKDHDLEKLIPIVIK